MDIRTINHRSRVDANTNTDVASRMSTQSCPKKTYYFFVHRDHEVYMYVVYIWKWSSAHALGGVSGVASFITTDEQLQ